MEGNNVVCPVMVSTAEPADFPSLASILPLANAKTPIYHLMFKRDTSLGNSQSLAERWTISQFSAAETSTEPKTYVLKAVPVGQESAVGFAIVRVVDEPRGDGQTGEKKECSGMTTQNGEAVANSAWHDSGEDMLEPDFCAVYMARLKEVCDRYMVGKRHAYFSTLMILPSNQHLGIASSIIQYAITHLHLDTLPVWLCAQPDGYHLYRKFGWRDVESVEMRLEEWAGEGRGYGSHMTVCMLREA